MIAEFKVNGKPVELGSFDRGVHVFPLKPGDLKKGYNDFSVTLDPKFGPNLTSHDFAVYLNRKGPVASE